MSVCLIILSTKLKLVCTAPRVPPRFSELPENVDVTYGGSVNLTCVAIGTPPPYVSWRRGELELTPEHDVPRGKNVLMLNDVRQSATYTCVARQNYTNKLLEADVDVRVRG